MSGKRALTRLLTLATLLTTLNLSWCELLRPEVVESPPKGKRNLDWIPAFQLVEILPQSRFRKGDHIIRYYIGALGKDGKFYRPPGEVQVTEVKLSSDASVTSLLIPGCVFVYPDRIFRFGSQNTYNPAPAFRIGKPIGRLAANEAELNLVSIGSGNDIYLPYQVRHFAQLPRDQYGNPTAWATDRIGFSRSSIGRYGCVLATLAMMLDYMGINYNGDMDPGVLNEKLKKAYTNFNIDAFSAGDRIVLDRAVEAASLGKARFVSLREEAVSRNKFAILDRELSLGRPIMVTVPSTTAPGGEHYVLVYARHNGDYLIKDPAYESRTKLSDYTRFTPRGVVVPAVSRTEFVLRNQSNRIQ